MQFILKPHVFFNYFILQTKNWFSAWAKIKQVDNKQTANKNFNSGATVADFEQELNAFLSKIAPNRLVSTWFLSLLFLLVPAIGLLITFLYRLDKWELGESLFGLGRLFTGATTRSLTIEGGQWWRIFSYGLSTSGTGSQGSLLILIFVGLALFKIWKFNEVLFGIPKTLVTFFAAYILTGFFSSVTAPEVITGGQMPLLGIAFGVLLGGLGVQEKTSYQYVRSKLGWPVFLLFISPFLEGTQGDYLGIVVGLAFGMAIMGLFSFQKQSLWAVINFGLILGVLVITAVVFGAVPQRYAPAENLTIKTTLLLYGEHGWMSSQAINHVFKALDWAVNLPLPKQF